MFTSSPLKPMSPTFLVGFQAKDCKFMGLSVRGWAVAGRTGTSLQPDSTPGLLPTELMNSKLIMFKTKPQIGTEVYIFFTENVVLFSLLEMYSLFSLLKTYSLILTFIPKTIQYKEDSYIINAAVLHVEN